MKPLIRPLVKKRESKSLICVFELRGFIRGFTREAKNTKHFLSRIGII